MRLILLSAILLLSAFVAQAAPQATEEKFYQIDILVFARDRAVTTDEQFPQPRDTNTSETIEPVELPQSKLAGAAAELAKDGGVRVLAHRTWTQGSEEKKTAKPARIHTDVLDGTVQFYVSRFLHADVNLQLRDAAMPEQAYRIVERRRVKSQEIHYFDHPHFGVLLLVTPIKTQPELKR